MEEMKTRLERLSRMILNSLTTKNNCNHIVSMNTLEENIKGFNRHKPFLVYDNTKIRKRFYMQIEFAFISSNTVHPPRCIMEGKTYGKNYQFIITKFEEDYDEKGNIIRRSAPSIKKDDPFEIPSIVEYYGVSDIGGLPELNQPGGYFIVSGKKKFIVNKRHNTSTLMKVQGRKKANGVFRVCFYSIPPSFLDLRHAYNTPRYSTASLLCDKETRMETYRVTLTKGTEVIDLFDVIAKTTRLSRKELLRYLSSGFDEDITTFLKQMLSAYDPDKNIALEPYVLFPHLFVAGAFTRFRFLKSSSTIGFLCIEIIRTLIMSSFYRDRYPDRSCVNMKRIQSCGVMIYKKISEVFNKMITEYYNQCTNNVVDYKNTLNLKTNILSVFNTHEAPLVRHVNILNNNHMIVAPLQYSNDPRKVLTNVIPTRKINETTIDTEDVSDTPSSSNSIGLIKRTTATAKITESTNENLEVQFDRIISFLLKWREEHVRELTEPVCVHLVEESQYPIIHINQDQVDQFVADFKYKKRRGEFGSYFVGISTPPCYTNKNRLHITHTQNYFSVLIHISNSRFVRPYLIIENGKINVSEEIDYNRSYINHIMNNPDMIEFLDGDQKVYSNICASFDEFVAMSEEERKKYDYMEINEDTCLSVNTALLPDVSKNDGIRATMGNAQMKQIVLPPINYIKNSNESGHVLSGMVERSCLVNNCVIESGMFNNGKGENLMIMFADLGDNHNDAVIFCKEAIDAGVLNITEYVPHLIENGIDSLSEEPDRWKSNQSKINSKTGLPDFNTLLFEGDAIAKSISLKTINNTVVPYDSSKIWSQQDPGRVIRWSKQINAKRTVMNVNCVANYPIRCGDKFCTENVQKGTVGSIIPVSHLPYTKDGRTPTVVINSTSILGRVTHSAYSQTIFTNWFIMVPHDEDGILRYKQLKVINKNSIEEIYNTACADVKKHFPHWSEDKIREVVGGIHQMYDPVSGEPMEKKVWLTPLMYCRLPQLASNKINIRGMGKDNKYGQPPSGKKNAGGGRQGEMELENIATYGAAGVMKEITSDSNRSYSRTYLCENCNFPMMVVQGNRDDFTHRCVPCNNLGIITKALEADYPVATNFVIQLSILRGLHIKLERQ